jgi:hypothetical protein
MGVKLEFERDWLLVLMVQCAWFGLESGPVAEAADIVRSFLQVSISSHPLMPFQGYRTFE